MLWLVGGLVGLMAGLCLLLDHSVDAPPGSGGGRARDTADAAASAQADDEPTLAAIGPPTGDAPPEDSLPDDADDDPLRQSVPADQRQGPRVLVVRGNPPVPVADAEVFFVTEAVAREQEQRWARSGRSFQPGTPIDWPERHGQRLRSDAQGLAQLPPTRAPWLVAAIEGGDFAHANVPPNPRVVTLTLQRDETVRLQARDANGEPGRMLPVALLLHRGQEDQANAIWRGRTDAAGEAVCTHFQLRRPPPQNRVEDRFAALLEMPAPEPIWTAFAGRPATTAPVVLQVPPHGRVEARLTDHRGQPLLSPASVSLWIDRPRDQKLSFPVPRNLDRPSHDKPPGEHIVVFAPVAANVPFRVGARHGGDRMFSGTETLWSAPSQGEVLQVELPLEPQLSLLAGRLWLPDGRPLGNTAVQAALWRADGPIGGLQLHAIADGRFDLVQPPRGGVPELWLELRVPGELAIKQREPASDPIRLPLERAELGARVRFAALRPGERRELGDIVLGELPPLCRGIVVDDLGEPIANVDLRLQQKTPQPPGRPGRGNPNVANLNQDQQQPDPWRDLPLLRTRSDEDGMFWLPGELPRGELRLRGDTNQHFANSLPVQQPGQVLRLVLQRNGILRGRVLLPDWVADNSVSLELRPFEEDRRKVDTRKIELQRRGGGRFVVEPLRPGRYDAIVSIRSVPTPLLVLQDLFVPPGEARDARLRPLDLRQSLFRYRLRSVDVAGRPLVLDGPILARMASPDGKPAHAAFRWQRGRAELITGSSMLELVAFGRGCEPTTVMLTAGDHDVYLRQVSPALVQLPMARLLCGPTRRVRVSVVFAGDTGLPEWLSGQDQRTGESFSFPRWELGKSQGAWLGLEDLVEIPIVRSGKYEVILRLHATDSEQSPQASVPLGSHELRVDAGFHAATTVPLDQAKIAAAIAQLDQQLQRSQNNRQAGNRR